jgi:8-oxo-dGTP pyrophosphatase MutT (NUDIX family)
MPTITDKMVARALITKKIRRKLHVLLVRKEAEPTTYELPGGRRKTRERFIDALVRELYEELNLRVPASVCRKWGRGVLRTTHDHDRSVTVMVYTINKVGRVKAKSEIIECRWVAMNELLTIPLERKTKLLLWLYFRFGNSLH